MELSFLQLANVFNGCFRKVGNEMGIYNETLNQCLAFRVYQLKHHG